MARLDVRRARNLVRRVGPAFFHQSHSAAVGRIAGRHRGAVRRAVANTVSFTAGVTLVIAVAVILGAVTLVRPRYLGQFWLSLGALPIVLAGIVGVFTHSFLDRTLTVAAWAPVLAVAFFVDAVMRRSRLAQAVALVGCIVVIVPGTATFLTGTWGEGVRPGRSVPSPGRETSWRSCPRGTETSSTGRSEHAASPGRITSRYLNSTTRQVSSWDRGARAIGCGW